MAVALIVMAIVLGTLGSLAAAKGAIDDVDVKVEDIDVDLTDKKGKVLKAGFATLTDPNTLVRIREGKVRTTLKVKVTNKGKFPITAKRVEYDVKLNKKKAGSGTWPKKGKGPVTLAKGKTFSTKVEVDLPTKKVLKDPSKIVAGGAKIVVQVQGTAHAEVLGLTASQPFSVKKTKRLTLK